jgi:hypothetical protein
MTVEDYLISKGINPSSFLLYIDTIPQTVKGINRTQNWWRLLSKEYPTSWNKLNEGIEARISQYLTAQEQQNE